MNSWHYAHGTQVAGVRLVCALVEDVLGHGRIHCELTVHMRPLTICNSRYESYW